MTSFDERVAALGWCGTELEDELRALAGAVASELDALRANCEAARLEIATRSATIQAASRADGQAENLNFATQAVTPLYASIDDVEARKTAALEAELVRVDIVLEMALSILPAARAARGTADAFSDAALTCRVDALVSALESLPRLPVEPSAMHFDPSATSDALSVPQFGRLIVVRAARAADVVLSGPRFALPGKPLRLKLALAPAFGSCDSDDLPATLSHLACHLRAVVVRDGDDMAIGAPQHVTADSVCVNLTFELPPDLPQDADLRTRIFVSGKPMEGSLSFAIYSGFAPGLCIADTVEASNEYSSPSISAATGTLYKLLSTRRALHPNVETFGGDGLPHPPPPSLACRLSRRNIAALTASNGGSLGPIIVLATLDGSDCVISAFSEGCTSTKTPAAASDVSWERRFTGPHSCLGIAVLPDDGVAVVGKCADTPVGSLFVLDLASGDVCASVPARYAGFISADAASRTVFASVAHPRGPYANSFCVAVFRYENSSLTSQGFLPDLFSDNAHIALSVVPPSSPEGSAHLVACPRLKSTLRVFKLPSLTSVLVHNLATGTKVVGLGTDPAGRTLIVCDQTTQAMHTLAWPLPGDLPDST